MITKSKWDKYFGDTCEVECDNCGDIEDIEGDFDECISFLKKSGWLTRKEDGEWLNYCPICYRQLGEE